MIKKTVAKKKVEIAETIVKNKLHTPKVLTAEGWRRKQGKLHQPRRGRKS